MRSFNSSFSNRTHLIPMEEQVKLAPIGDDRFRNRHNQGNVYHALFGGQVVAQALAASGLTVADDRSVHSCHAYFLRAGDDDKPVDYHVERTRDGRRFSSRHVSAWQDGKMLLTMDSSYRTPLSGFDHQSAPMASLDPEAALSEAEMLEQADPALQSFLAEFLSHYPIELRVASISGFAERSGETRRQYWLRSRFPVSSDAPAVHAAIFAYLSDFMLAGVPLAAHICPLPGRHVTVASLDHCIWFHRPLRADEWLLFETDSPNAKDGVNLARALVYDRQGRLVASLAQEALQLPTGDGEMPI